jgi:hypothetical protein
MNVSLGTLRTEAQNQKWFPFLCGIIYCMVYNAQTINRFFVGGGGGAWRVRVFPSCASSEKLNVSKKLLCGTQQ